MKGILMGQTILELKAVEKTYLQGSIEVRALKGVNFRLDKGEFAAVCGPSGSGKTTMLNIIGALDDPTSGTVLFEGRDLAGLSGSAQADLRLTRIGFIFQAYNLVPVLTAYENVEMILVLQKVRPVERKARAEKILEQVGLKDMMRRKPSELSGGQQQRVAIARAVVANPALVLADEPTANVDSETAESLLDLMLELNKIEAATFLFSTHDARVMNRARRIVTLKDGIITDDTLKQPCAC
jgi:putative ABC transport system ATP-binding protein